MCLCDKQKKNLLLDQEQKTIDTINALQDTAKRLGLKVIPLNDLEEGAENRALEPDSNFAGPNAMNKIMRLKGIYG